MSDKQNLLLLFERPQEPVFMGKGKDDVVFDVPDAFLTERYRAIRDEVESVQRRIGLRIPVENIAIPDMSIPMSLGRHEQFSLWIPRHRKVAAKLIDIFMGMRSISDFLSCAVYARDRVNPLLFNYAISVAIIHRPDTKDLKVPSFVESFPEKFVDSKVFAQVREEATVVADEALRRPITIPKDYTASDLEEEHRLWYFREDLGINLHHWHWHLVYPFDASNQGIVAKDRRGELFYYMHQQIVARYNFERFSNRMARVKRLNNMREPIAEAYFPKMNSLVASRAWPSRTANTKMSDLNRELDQIRSQVSDLERWRDRFYEAIHQGFVVDQSGNRIALNNERGIDHLGNMMESSILSPNQQLYGDFHNMLHVFIALAHDPDNRHLETFGVIGDAGTAMRDPAFYRIHAFVDDIFQEHKQRLPPYTMDQLTFPRISVVGVNITADSGPPNRLQTHWQQSDIDMSRGMDFVAVKGNVLATFTHLNHVPFTYNIQVINDSGEVKLGMVRIFLAPKKDERGLNMSFREQRQMMTEMDKFVAAFRPGQNLIRRRSTDSSITIPFERTFRDLRKKPAEGTPDGEDFNYCGCGWPQHMLVPRGTPEGLQCQLFVMVSDYELDKVDQDLSGRCNDAASFCGVRDRLYPDKRAMGFPFDRSSRVGADNLNAFVTPNMIVQDCVIVHKDEVINERKQ